MVLKDVIKIDERFQTSVNIRFDIDKINKIDEFIPAKSTLDVLESYLESIFEKNNNRSTLLVGPYGKGKSHLLLVLLALLRNREDKKWQTSIKNFYDKVKKQNRRLAGNIRKNILCESEPKKYLPIIISFGRSDLETSYRLALFQALEREKLSDIMPDSVFDEVIKKVVFWEKKYPDTYQEFLASLKDNGYDIKIFEKEIGKGNRKMLDIFKKIYKELTAGSEFNPLLENNIPKIYENVAYELKKYGYTGIIIVFDEFSKFIEGEDSRETSKDMELIQSMCELCNSSKEPDIRHIFVTHKSIKEYGKFLSAQILNSFRGVEGRIQEMVFRTNAQNYYELMMNVIHKDESVINDYYDEYGIDNSAIVDRTYNMTNMYTIFDKKDYERIIVRGCFPLAPLTTYTLVKISEKVGQNERTVFTFMSGNEPNTLSRFVKDHVQGENTFVSADIVFDYFSYIFEKDISNEKCHSEYIKAKYLIKKIAKEQEKNEKEAYYGDRLFESMKKIIKCIALLNMLNQTELVPNDKCLVSMTCLEDNINLFEDAKKALLGYGYLNYRQRSDSYVFRINTDTNLENEIEKRKNKVKCTTELISECFKETTERRYELPKEYNDEKKMTRYFEYSLEDGKKLENARYLKGRIENELSQKNFADGKIFLCMGEFDICKIEQSFEENLNERIVIVCPDEAVEFEECIKKYYAIKAIRSDDKYLKENETAFEESYFCLDDVVYEINSRIHDHYMPGDNNTLYLYASNADTKENKIIRKIKADTSRELQKLLSSICSDYYGKTPSINHELINKNEITAPIKKARTNIIENILAGEDMSKWDNGTSSEATIYRAVIKNKGLTGDKENDAEKLNDSDISELIEKIDEFIIKSVGNKNCFTELYNEIKGKDFGIRNGVIPIYVAYCLSKKYGTPLIYYDKIENEISAQILAKADEEPEKCYLYIEPDDSKKENYLKEIMQVFDICRDGKNSISDSIFYDTPMKKLRVITNGLQQWYRGLPGYCRYASPAICFMGYRDFEGYEDRGFLEKCERFRRDLAGNIQSAREYLLERLPEITGAFKDDAVDYEMCIRQIRAIKLKIEEMYNTLLIRLTIILKTTFSDEKDTKDRSLRTIFEQWSHKNAEKLEGVVFDHSASELFKCVTKNNIDDEEKIINKISEGFIGLALRDYKDETIELFKKELEKAYSELENMLKNEKTTGSAISFTMDTADGKKVRCKLSEYDESPATDIIEAQIREVLQENDYDKNAQVSAVLKILGEIVG